MFGQVIVNDQRILSLFHKIFTDCTSGIRGDILHRSVVIGAGDNNNRMLHRIRFFEFCDYLSYRRFLLTNCHINTKNILIPLIDNRIDCDGCFSGLTIPDNQFSLTPANGNHRINRFDTGLQRRIHIGSLMNSRRNPFNRTISVESNRTFSVNRLAKRINNPPQQPFPDRNRSDTPCLFYNGTLFDCKVIA